jgi:DMSO/TMAO reductase YedYZ molybdopterin-dependent catalytic subunit
VPPTRREPQGPRKRDRLAPHQRRERRTPTPQVLVLGHLGVPRLERDRGSLTMDGWVEHPRTLGFDDWLRYPQTEVG